MIPIDSHRLTLSSLLSIIIILLAPCLVEHVYAAEESIELDSINIPSVLAITPRVWIYEDQSGILAFDEIKQNKHLFQPHSKTVFNGGYSQSSFWLYFKIKNDTSAYLTRYIRIPSPLIDEFILYEQQEEQTNVVSHGRLHNSAYSWEHGRVILTKLTLKPSSISEYWIKIRSTDSLAFSLSLLTESGLRKAEITETGFFSFYYGLVTAMAIFSLFLYITLKETIYIYYLLVVLTHHILFFLVLNGMFSYLLNIESIWWSREAISLCISASMLALINFCQAFFHTKSSHPLLHKILNINLVLNSIGIALSFSVDHYYAIMFSNIAASATGIVMFVLGVAALKAENSAAKYYLIAWTFAIFGGVVYSLKTWSILPSNLLTEYSWQLGAGIESVLLSMAIANRINRESRSREKAQQDLVATQKTINESLDRLVRERTEALEKANKKLKQISITDALTGLYNRRHFDDVFETELNRAYRECDWLALLIMDIDHFKNLNDKYGHPFGDVCLQRTAATLRNCIHRPGDLVARFGGEEFVALLPNTNQEDAVKLANRILREIRETTIENAEISVHLTVSIGVVSIKPENLGIMENVLKQADMLLYQAKNNGRNRVESYSIQ